jgi:tetratricopeptide (TPR) repeat protein
MKNCPYCGKLTDPKLDNCVHCGGFLRKGAAQPRAGGAAQSQNCPSCGALVREGDIICVACGTNLLTGQKIAKESKVAAPRRNTGIYIALGAVALIVVVGAIAAIAYLAQDPVSRAVRLVEENRITEAMSILNEVVASDPDNARAHLELGKIHWTTRSYPQAAESFRKAHRVDPNREDAGVMAVVSLAQQGGEANLDQQVDVLQRLVDSESDNPDYWYLLALAKGARGDTQGEVDALENVLALRPEDTSANVALGVAKALEGDLETAEQSLSRLLTRDATNADLNAAYGFVAGMRDDSEDAVEHLNAALEQQTSVSAEALTQLGVTLMAQGQFPEAEPPLAAATQMPGASPAATYYHAVCLKELGEGRNALREFESLVNAGGDYSALAAVKAAEFYLSDGNPESAASIMEKASRRLTGTDEAERRTVLGRIAAGLGNFSDARENFRAAKEADAAYGPAYLENGLLYINEQNIEEGIKEIRRYLEVAQADSEAAEIEIFVDQLERSLPGRSAPAPAGDAA